MGCLSLGLVVGRGGGVGSRSMGVVEDGNVVFGVRGSVGREGFGKGK